MIGLAGATFSFGDLTLEESAAVLRDLGFSRADVGAGWAGYHQVLPQRAAENPTGEAERVRRVMGEHGLEVSELFVMHFGKPVNHPDPQVRAWTRRMFAGIATFAHQAGFRSVMLIPGHVHVDEGQTPVQAFDLSVSELTAMVAVATQFGLQCNVEPCVGSIAQWPADAQRLLDAVPGLGLTLDYAHQVQLGLGPDAIEPLHPRARHVHAKQSAPGSFQARPDEGMIDFHRLVRRLRDDGYDGTICVEFVSSQAVLDAGWDVRRETARLKEILEDALTG